MLVETIEKTCPRIGQMKRVKYMYVKYMYVVEKNIVQHTHKEVFFMVHCT